MTTHVETILNEPTSFVVCKECKGINNKENDVCVHCESELEEPRSLAIYNSILSKLDKRMFEGETHINT